MDHRFIEDTALPERYATGRLEEPERALFEEHLVDCPICLERIEASEGLAAGFKAVSASAEIPVSTRLRPKRWARRSGWLVAGACAAGLLAVVLTGARFERLGRELLLERTARLEARSQLNTALQQLASERTAREAAEARLTVLPRRTPVQIPLLALIATRGTTMPALELTLAPEPFLLLAEREEPPHFQSYVVTIRSSEGVAIWQGNVLPSSRDSVVVALDSRHFAPGTYSLALEGEGAGGRLVPVQRYAFRTVASTRLPVTPGTETPP